VLDCAAEVGLTLGPSETVSRADNAHYVNKRICVPFPACYRSGTDPAYPETMRSHSLPLGVGAAALVAALTACTSPAPESRLGVYQTEAETISAEILDLLPVGSEQTVKTGSRAWFDESEWLIPPERQAAHWTTESTITLVDDTATAVAAAMREHLVAEHWTDESIVDPGGFRSDVYRMAETAGEWIVEVSWRDEQRLVLMVQSPVTVRGSDPA
jgi:hypothetical protein